MTSLQGQISKTIAELVFGVLAPNLLHYINSSITTRDGEVLSSQQAFDRAVKEDKDILLLIERYRPSYIAYINRAKRIRNYIKWDSAYFTSLLVNYLQENGIQINEEGRNYIYRTVERFRNRIYS
jgi:hypothetical protein